MSDESTHPGITPAELAEIHQSLDDRANPGGTHWDGCHLAHRDCLARRLLEEVERLREERSAWERQARKFEELVGHCWVHSGYEDCGSRQMDSEMRALYEAVVGIDVETLDDLPDDRASVIPAALQGKKEGA